MVSSQSETNEKLERLEDEFDLLKTEVRQTLVDLKEFIMKGRTIFPDVPSIPSSPPPAETRHEEPSVADPLPEEDAMIPESLEPSLDPPVSENPAPLSPLAARPDPTQLPDINNPTGGDADPTRAPDAVMMSNIIWWLGTTKRRGITLHQVAPFIDAYEMSGYMSPTVAKLIYRTMAEMDSTIDPTLTSPPMPQDFSEGMMQLNEIVTSPNHVISRGEAYREPLNAPSSYPDTPNELT